MDDKYFICASGFRFNFFELCAWIPASDYDKKFKKTVFYVNLFIYSTHHSVFFETMEDAENFASYLDELARVSNYDKKSEFNLMNEV